MRHFLANLLVLSSAGFAQGLPDTPPSPQQIQEKLDSAQDEFDVAKQMFNPYFSGPLITGSAHNAPPGLVNIQPYLFLTDTYGVYTGSRRIEHVPDLWTINPQVIVQTGITNWLDVTFVPQGVFNWRQNADFQNWGDFQVTLGFQLVTETPERPALRLTYSTVFPTGHYQHLTATNYGTDATGAGSFQTQFSLNISKVLWNFPLHPMQVRGNIIYNIPSHVDVSGINSYGGAYDTNGTVNPGNTFQLDGSIEISIVQNWVFALDVIYKYVNKTRFSGYAGENNGMPARMTAPSGDQLSIAPAIEYNPSDMEQFIVGPWFSVTGRNNAAFVSFVLSYDIAF